MSAESEQQHSWVRVGTTYAGVVEKTIVALVYHAGVLRGEQTAADAGGAEADAGPGWYL
ncbi:MAG: hypothetical protein H0T15_00025, partial [Thermoleophilaceae bacterium]|nr:hypothetical protein [Thermoleophilaceae bacterium]